ncbi:MAG: glycosyl transferase family protein [Pontixanthobacter sp.]
MGEFTAWQWLMLLQHELLLFAGVFFLIGAADELAVDLIFLWLKLTGRARTQRVADPGDDNGGDRPLHGIAAVFIPAWREDRVIGATVSHALAMWPHDELRVYVGCYPNDPATHDAVRKAAAGDARLRLITHHRSGPTTKADCLNQLYHALREDEAASGEAAHMVVLHDAEDMVDPAALNLLDDAVAEADLAQLPVLPLPQAASPWIGGHYLEEFAEAHGKAMVVRDALRTGMPLAGVGCAIRRPMLERLAATKPDGMPFAADCLTEDYELGIGVSDLGGTAWFIRARNAQGALIATRAFFPADLVAAVRQKTRWIHGIAFQGWDRLGWSGRPAETWMRLRDRRGPFTALVLAAAYLLLILSAAGWIIGLLQNRAPPVISDTLALIVALNFASFAWRALWRFAFTAREYGIGEGLHAVLRIPVANIIAIMAGRRALMAYLRTMTGKPPVWDKTEHHAHPASLINTGLR